MSPHVDLGHAADAWLRSLQAQQLQPRTLDAYRRHIAAAIDLLGADLHSAAELAGHRDVNQTRRYAGRAKIARVRGGVDAIEAATAAKSEQPGWAANPRRDPSSGRTWVRTRDASSEGYHGADGGEGAL